MTVWVAVSYGALDVSDVEGFEGIEFLVTPTVAGVPLALSEYGARFWRPFTLGEIDDQNLTNEELALLDEMVEAGIISSDRLHPHRQFDVGAPWLISPMHELVYALVASLAAETETRLLFMKGPILHSQNLRRREHSGDVDIIVELRGRGALIDRLQGWGWLPVSNIWDGTEINHSRTLRPDAGWGCEIDAHIRMPGIGLADEEAFSLLLDEADEYEFAGVGVLAPCRTDHAVLAALHVIRPHPGRRITEQQHAAQMQEGESILRLAGEQTLESAAKLGTIPVLWSLLQVTFPVESLKYAELARAQAPPDWLSRMQPSVFRYYLSAMRRVRWFQRPVLLLRILWPGKDVVSQWGDHAGMRHSNVTLVRARRLMGGLTQILSPRRNI